MLLATVKLKTIIFYNRQNVDSKKKFILVQNSNIQLGNLKK